MPLTADSILQENSGATSGADTASQAVTLPTGTAAGSTVLVAFNQSALLGSVTLPTGFVLDAGTGNTTGTVQGTYGVARKSGTAAGETSWTFTASAATQWAWYACEVTGLDLTDPLEASAAVASTGIGSNATTTKSTGTTGANPSTDTLVFACFGSDLSATNGSFGTWTAYTNGFEERAQLASTGGGSISPREIAIAAKLSGGATTGPFESTGTYTSGPTIGNIAGMIAAYRGADSPVVNPLAWMLGFEHATHSGLLSSLLTVIPIAAAAAGTVGTDYIVQASSARAAPSGYGCRIIATAANRYLNAGAGSHFAATAKAGALGLNVRVVSGSGTVVAAELQPGSGTTLQLVYDVAGTRYGLRWGAAGTVAWQAGTTALGTWVWADFAASFSGATWHADWRLETGASTYTDQTSPADLTGQTATTLGAARIGGNLTQTMTADYDDAVLSIYRSAYPLGPHTIQALTVDPAGTPTVSGTVGNFALVTNNATGAALTVGTLTNARDAIDDRPPVISAASDGVVQTTAAATDYLQFPLATVAVGATRVIAGARLLACLISTTGAGAGALGIRGWDGASEASLVAASGITPGSSTTAGNTVPPWATAMWNPPGGWTQAKLDAAALRLGFSSDATPDMGVHALYLEVATRAAVTARQLSVEDDLFTVDVVLSPYSSASVSYVLTSNDAARGATFSYSVAGTPQTPVYVAASSTTTVTVDADAFGDVNPDSFEPDPA